MSAGICSFNSCPLSPGYLSTAQPNRGGERPYSRKKPIYSKDYWQELSFYREHAVEVAGHDAKNLSELITYLRQAA